MTTDGVGVSAPKLLGIAFASLLLAFGRAKFSPCAPNVDEKTPKVWIYRGRRKEYTRTMNDCCWTVV